MTHQSTKTQPYYIPTPETNKIASEYDNLYPTNYKQPKGYIKTAIGDDPLQKFPKFNANEEDEAFLAPLRAKGSLPAGFDLQLYEMVIDCLEEAAHKYSESIVSSECAERLRDKYAKTLPDESVLNSIIEFWRQRRAQRSVLPHLKHEDLGKLGADPYVCFRRRELKIPRKTRRSDAQIVDRLKKLHLDLSTMKLVLEAAIKRDR